MNIDKLIHIYFIASVEWFPRSQFQKPKEVTKFTCRREIARQSWSRTIQVTFLLFSPENSPKIVKSTDPLYRYPHP